MTAMHEQISHSVNETIAWGRSLGARLRGGEVIALVGELGAGKTHLIKGIAQGLAVTDPDAVTSPTFTLINEYPGRLMLVHVDAYRLENADQLEQLGFDEYVDDGNVVVVEWADRVAELMDAYDAWRIRLEHLGPADRRIGFTPGSS